jgi:hypothetical protein
MKIVAATLLILLFSTLVADAGKRGETCWRTNRATGQHFRSC